ncbi:hypothetical protein Tco_0730430 [Tanacetum coccineum]|uniref:Reverse transcriptase zinc-binding domain-containing protein n=1 Tax=Tanacetum coccineum TaxID=301880 RepID=A0ABQ4YRS1_9ASTR
MVQPSLVTSFRRNPKSGTDASQMAMLTSLLEGICLPNMLDRWCWSLSGDEEFSVSFARILIDDKTLGTVGSKTHWCKYVPLKVNILSWSVKLNNLPTRLNLSRRGMAYMNKNCGTFPVIAEELLDIKTTQAEETVPEPQYQFSVIKFSLAIVTPIVSMFLMALISIIFKTEPSDMI